MGGDGFCPPSENNFSKQLGEGMLDAGVADGMMSLGLGMMDCVDENIGIDDSNREIDGRRWTIEKMKTGVRK